MRLLVKTLLRKIFFRWKITVNKSKTKKKMILGIFANLLPELSRVGREICISTFFEHCLVFASFKPIPRGFGS